MSGQDLFSFRKNGKNVEVFTGKSSSDVYFSVNGSGSRYSGLRYDSTAGYYKTSGGSLRTWEEAEAEIRSQV
jgi:hypothetical protein